MTTKMLIDTHTHIADPTGVDKIILIGTNLKDSQKVVATAQTDEKIFASVGIHPEYSCENWEKFETLARQPKVVAVGECGLDYKSSSNHNDQKIAFQKQIEISQKLNLPLIIHSREATNEVLEILNQYQNLRGVFHFYNFGKSKIAKVLEMGFFFGLDGNLTYEVGLQNVAKLIPLEKILLETDSPYLSPEPVQNSPNRPKNVKIIASFLSKLKSVSLEVIEKITSENAYSLFNF